MGADNALDLVERADGTLAPPARHADRARACARIFAATRRGSSPAAAPTRADTLTLPGIVAQAFYVGQGYRYRVRTGGAEVWVHAPERIAEGTSASRRRAARRRCSLFPRASSTDAHAPPLGGFHALSSHHRAPLVAAALAACRCRPRAQTTLNVVTAGDQNMVDYVNNYLGPKFETMNPGVKVRAVGTGPGDAGSQKIYEKLSAQQKAGTAAWDTDVAVVHQRGAATMVKENLLMPYRNDIAAGKLVTRDTAKNALGANVDGYVLPMFHSQIAFAYNPDARQGAAEVVRRARRVGEEEPEAVRLQRRQGRHVRRRLRDGLGRRQQRPRRQAREGPVRRRPTRRRSTSRSRASRTSTRTS